MTKVKARGWSLVAFLVVLATWNGWAQAQQETPSLEQANKLLDEGAYAPAVTAFEKRIAKHGRGYDDLMGLGRALFAQHESSRSMGLFYESSKLKEGAAEPWAMIARIEQRKGMLKFRENRAGYETDLVEAGIHFEDAARRSENPGAYLAEAAGAYLTAGRYEQALGVIDRAKGKHDAEALRNMELAACFLGGKFSRFLKVSDAAVAAGDDRYQHLIRRLEVLVRMENYEAAEALFHQLVPVAASFGRYDPWMILEKHWLEGTSLKTRIRAFEKQRDADQGDPLPRFYLSLSYGLANSFEESAREARTVLEAWPKNAAAPRYLATALLKLDRIKDAHAVIREALILHAEDPAIQETANWVVKAYVDRRDYAAAISVQELLIAAAPENISYRSNHANLLKNQGRLNEAVAIFEALCRTARDTPDRLARLFNDYGLSLNGLKRTKEAEKAFVEALDHDATNLDARENLGVLLYTDNRFEEARKAFEEVLRRHGEAKEPLPRWRSRYYLGLMAHPPAGK